MTTTTIGHATLGEVFTRRWVVDTILDLVGYTSDIDLTDKVLIEPSVGSGAFLAPIVERLCASAIRLGVPWEALAGAIHGFDLQPQHVASSRRLAALALEANGASEPTAAWLASSWIKTQDYLLDESAPQTDFVVGNPPYIRSDDLDDGLEARYRARWRTMKGRSDIFIGFYERSLALLRPGGHLGFICADRWMRNQYGAPLRELVGRCYSIDAIWQMHDVDAFEAEVSAYPAITILSRQRQGVVAVIDTTAEFGESGASQAAAFSRSSETEGSGDGWTGTQLPQWFTGPDLWPAGGPHRIQLLEDLAQRFPTLEETGVDTKISIGVATGADKAYIVTPDADVEPDRLLPMVSARDIRSGRLETPSRVMINPWDDNGHLVNLDNYPRMRKTLAAHPAVIKRFVARRNPGAWHRTIDKVHPGLKDRPKLLLQDMKAQITPVLEPGGFYPHHNLYYITSSGWDLEVLGGLLLSRIAQAFIEAYGVKMRGGTLRFQAQYLRKIRVPAPEMLSGEVADRLRKAYRASDRDAATRASEVAYGLAEGTY